MKHSKTTWLNSRLFDESNFYHTFIEDLRNCKKEVVIESPYITASRMELLYPTLKDLLIRKIQIHIVTRNPTDHDENIRHQATNEILECNELGINTILLTGFHHRKLAIIDRAILWEGSLNILSQNNSMEIMRRIKDERCAKEMFDFLKLKKLINIT